MPVVNPTKLVALQQASENIRNICILAHVDHGKTSLSDALLATNGIISPKLAGKIRYLDSRPDEQLRGITMESSAISLLFSMMRRASPDAEPKPQDYLINLIDSPGHIDFSSEVSTASRLCDGAVVLVDAVEGVCSQTVTVLRQTWMEKLRPLLVINKMDRLVTELRMSASEAYTHLSQLLEQVNAVMGSFVLGEMQEDDLRWRERMEERVRETKSKQKTTDAAALDAAQSDTDSVTAESAYEEKDDEDIYFAPEKNNVIFSSAIDGWAFTVKQFAGLYERKLGIKRALLEKVLWGDFFLDPKSKRILSSKHLKGRNLKPMFVQLVLENIWAVYDATTGGPSGKGDPAMVEKITKSLSLTIPNHVLRSRDPRSLLTALFAAWLPLPTAILVSVIEHLPSPATAQAERMGEVVDNSPGGDSVDKAIRDAMIGFKGGRDQPVVAYVSKMISVKESELPQNKRQAGGTMTAEEARELARKKRAEFAKAQAATDGDGLSSALAGASLNDDHDTGEPDPPQADDPEHLIGFARLFSGTLNVGDEVWVLPPKFNPAQPASSEIQKPKRVSVTALYLLMGRSLEALQSVPAGVVFGIGGLEGAILKSGTLCSQAEGAVNLAGVNMGGSPIVRVALEPVMPSDLDKMIHGLKLLVQSDPCAEYEVLENGEHVILTAGELHLERCLKDLRERFAKCEIQAGEPIVPYRETIVNAPAAVEVDLEHAPRQRDQQLPRGTIVGVTTSKQVTIRIRTRPLPIEVTAFLASNAGTIRRLYSERARAELKAAETESLAADDEETDVDLLDTGKQMTLDEFRDGMRKAFAEAKADREVWGGCIEKIAAFGPRRCGPNVLIDNYGTCQRVLQDHEPEQDGEQQRDHALTAKDFSDKISYAFQLATAQGPLCHEPMQGVAVFLEDVSIALPSSEESTSARDQVGRLTGEVIRTVRESVQLGFLDWSPRIMLAMYSCEIQASTEVLGRVYGVITRRRGRILSEAMKEGTPFFSIQALLPVVESFGFSEEMRKRTGGFAQPQLVFEGFEALGEDPFWVPASEEELEDLGELAERENVAKRYIDGVRKRKGLRVRGRRLVDAEKQKTLKR